MKNRYFILLITLIINMVFWEANAQNIYTPARKEAMQYMQSAEYAKRNGSLSRAYLEYTKAIELDPNYAKAYMKRALLLQQMGRYTESMQDHNRAIELNPHSEVYYDKRAMLNVSNPIIKTQLQILPKQ